MVNGIGALVLIYGGGYLTGDTHLGRFYAFLLDNRCHTMRSSGRKNRKEPCCER